MVFLVTYLRLFSYLSSVSISLLSSGHPCHHKLDLCPAWGKPMGASVWVLPRPFPEQQRGVCEAWGFPGIFCRYEPLCLISLWRCHFVPTGADGGAWAGGVVEQLKGCLAPPNSVKVWSKRLNSKLLLMCRLRVLHDSLCHRNRNVRVNDRMWGIIYKVLGVLGGVQKSAMICSAVHLPF